MRIVISGAAGALLLSGCGPGSAFDNGLRSGFRESAVQSCVAASHNAPNGAPANFDWQRLCNCAVDRYMANKSSDDLRNTNAQDPALQAASQQCAMEQMNAAGGAPALGAAPAGNQSKPDEAPAR